LNGGRTGEQPELAGLARISTPTLKRMEASAGPAPGMTNNLAAIRAALEEAGVVFDDRDGMVCVRLAKSDGQ
jgi:hypothetical protein